MKFDLCLFSGKFALGSPQIAKRAKSWATTGTVYKEPEPDFKNASSVSINWNQIFKTNI